MKNTINKMFLFATLISLFIMPQLSAEQDLFFPDPDATISMDLQDANLKDVLKIFSIQSGMNFIASEALQDRKLTLYLDKVPIQEAMDKIFAANNLSYELDPDSNIFVVKDYGKPEVETITKIYYLKYASVSTSPITTEVSSQLNSKAGADIINAVKDVLSPKGKISENLRTNSLIVTDMPSKFPVIEQVISHLDVYSPQILIEVEMLDVSTNVVDKLGFEFDNSPFSLIVPGSLSKAKFFMGDTTLKSIKSITTATAGAVSFGSTYAEVLDYLRTQTDTRYLARPKLLTLNNETAEIKITTNESIGIETTDVSNTGSITADPERQETGVSLRVTPQANIETGLITMFIYPEVSEAKEGNTLTSGNLTYTFRDPEVRSTKSTVRIKDGDTVIVGGLIRNEFIQTTKKLPILGDIPIIGMMFRHKDKTKDTNRELLVFITPRIIKDSYYQKAAKVARGSSVPAREQSPASSLVNRQAVINSRLNSLERME